MAAQRPKLGEILVRAGVIDEMQLRAALGEQRRWGQRLGVTLVKMGLVEEIDLVRGLAAQLQLPVVQLEGKRIADDVLALAPLETAERHMCLPIFVRVDDSGRTLFLAMEDPCNLEAIDDVGFRSGMKVQPVIAAPSELAEAIDRCYHRRPTAPSRKRPSGGALGAVPLDQESLFPSLPESGEDEAVGRSEPEIPADFGPPSAPERASEGAERALIRALAQLLVEKGVLDGDELAARVRSLRDEW